MADYFVICSGGSERQLAAIADGIIGSLRDEKTKPIGREGTAASHWVLVDFGSVIVHIFTPPERDYYGLEKHWSQAKTILSRPVARRGKATEDRASTAPAMARPSTESALAPGARAPRFAGTARRRAARCRAELVAALP